MTDRKLKVGDTVAYRNVVGDAGLGEVVFVHGATLLDLRALNTQGAPVMYQVQKDDSGAGWNTWKPLPDDAA